MLGGRGYSYLDRAPLDGLLCVEEVCEVGVHGTPTDAYTLTQRVTMHAHTVTFGVRAIV